MTDDRPPKRLVDDPETPEDMKEDLRRSSEIPLPSELSEELDRLMNQDWPEDGSSEDRESSG